MQRKITSSSSQKFDLKFRDERARDHYTPNYGQLTR